MIEQQLFSLLCAVLAGVALCWLSLHSVRLHVALRLWRAPGFRTTWRRAWRTAERFL